MTAPVTSPLRRAQLLVLAARLDLKHQGVTRRLGRGSGADIMTVKRFEKLERIELLQGCIGRRLAG